MNQSHLSLSHLSSVQVRSRILNTFFSITLIILGKISTNVFKNISACTDLWLVHQVNRTEQMPHELSIRSRKTLFCFCSLINHIHVLLRCPRCDHQHCIIIGCSEILYVISKGAFNTVFQYSLIFIIFHYKTECIHQHKSLRAEAFVCAPPPHCC